MEWGTLPEEEDSAKKAEIIATAPLPQLHPLIQWCLSFQGDGWKFSERPAAVCDCSCRVTVCRRKFICGFMVWSYWSSNWCYFPKTQPTNQSWCWPSLQVLELAWLRFPPASSSWRLCSLIFTSCGPRFMLTQIGWEHWRVCIQVCRAYLSLLWQMTATLASSLTNPHMVWDFGPWLPERWMLFLTSDVHKHEVRPKRKIFCSKSTYQQEQQTCIATLPP